MSAAVNSLRKMREECGVRVGDEGRRRQHRSITLVSQALEGFSQIPHFSKVNRTRKDFVRHVLDVSYFRLNM